MDKAQNKEQRKIFLRKLRKLRELLFAKFDVIISRYISCFRKVSSRMSSNQIVCNSLCLTNITIVLQFSSKAFSTQPYFVLKFKHVKKIIKRMCDDVVDGPSFELFFTFFH